MHVSSNKSEFLSASSLILSDMALLIWEIGLARKYPLLCWDEAKIKWRETKSRKYNVVEANKIKEIKGILSFDKDASLEMTSGGILTLPLKRLSHEDKHEVNEHFYSSVSQAWR